MPAIPSKKPFSTWVLIASLYTTQYLGLSFFSVALVAILREQGASLERISAVYVLGMIGACKFLWAPLVDQVRFTPKTGHFRGWLLLMQGLLVLILSAVSALDITADFGLIYALCILMALCGATQDIATDGLVCSLLTEKERGIGNGIQIAGGMFGFMLGAGLVLMAYPSLGWQKGVLLLTAGTAVSLLQLCFFAEPAFPAQEHRDRRPVARLVGFWKQPGRSPLAMLLLFPLGIAVAYSLLTPILVDSHWPLERIGLVLNVLGPLAGIVSSLLAGWMISRLGRRMTVKYCIGMQVLSVAAVLSIARGNASDWMVVTGVLLHFFGYVPSVTLLTTIMMDHVSKETPATDYTVQFSAYQFISMGIAGAGMAAAGTLGYVITIYISLAFVAVAGISAAFYMRNDIR